DFPLLLLVGDQNAAPQGSEILHSGDARAGRTPGDLLHGQTGHARLLDRARQTIIAEGHAVLIVDVPASEEMHLLPAIMRLTIIMEADLLLPADGLCKVTVGVERDACRF